MVPILYTFRRCPYAIRARMALHYSAVVVQQCEVELRSKPVELLRASPKATVPVLLLPDGAVIDQSLDIMHWALRQSDPDGWLSGADSDQVAYWIGLNDGPFKDLLDRYKYAERHPALSRATHRANALDAFVGPLDTRLREHPAVCGDRVSIADVALLPFVRQFAMVEPNWFDAAPLPGVQAWLDRWLQSELFRFVMDRQKPGL
ncbi:MAG: glutathione S-transferase [Rhodoferax sp.]|nr:glutathione S-transferase [Rhodoferax sp.]